MTSFHLCFAAGLILAVSCQVKPDEPAVSTAESSQSSADRFLANTPAGDLEEWVADIRNGLNSARTFIAADRTATQAKVVDLYAGRQEFLELYYGRAGRLSPPQLLADAVMTAESRFHELLVLASATPPAEAAAIERAIQALMQQYDVVLSEAKVRPERVRDAARTTGGRP